MEKEILSYKNALEEIENIVEKLEDNQLDIDELSKYVKRVSYLIEFCKTKLKSTEEEVVKILDTIEV